MKYLQLIRYQNLLLITFVQLILRYGFLKFQNIQLALNNFQYSFLVLSTVLIAAAGYIIHNIFDQDNENQSHKVIGKSISENLAYNLYFVLNVIGVCIGFYLSNVIQKPSFAGIFIIMAATLYMHATSLKQMLLIGNFIIALLYSFAVLIVGLFDLLPATYDDNRAQMGVLFSMLVDYAIFTFAINFIRQLVKNMEDVSEDYNQGMSTLPIAIGEKKAKHIIIILILLSTLGILWYINSYLMLNNLYYGVIYSLIFIVAPLILFVTKIYTASSKNNFRWLSALLKWVMFFGILSVLIITLNIKYHVKG